MHKAIRKINTRKSVKKKKKRFLFNWSLLALESNSELRDKLPTGPLRF